MRTLTIMEHISLDGVIQHSTDDNGFPYSDWTAPYRSPAGRDAVMAAQGERFDLLLGRRTYDIWTGFWPKAPSSPLADGINAATKYVATHRPDSLEWGRSRASDRTSSGGLCRGHAAARIRARRHESHADRHHVQYLQERRPAEDRLGQNR